MAIGTGVPQRIAALEAVAGAYDAVFSDIWGVVHDGIRKSADAEAALLGARRRGCKVVLLTNSPRPMAGVQAQLDAMGVSRESYDAVVTSGDVTRELIAQAEGPVFHLGPERDVDIFRGLSVERVGEDAARTIVVTGLFDDEAETPEDYAAMLRRLAARGLPMICANPDIVVHRGERLIWCAGALARDYAALGGAVRLAGKPHRPIYELATKAGGIQPGARVLAVGDGLMTDIKGANDFGIDVLLILNGIHEDELGGSAADAVAVAPILAGKGLSVTHFMADLR